MFEDNTYNTNNTNGVRLKTTNINFLNNANSFCFKTPHIIKITVIVYIKKNPAYNKNNANGVCLKTINIVMIPPIVSV